MNDSNRARVLSSAYGKAAKRGSISAYTLTYGKDFTRHFRDTHFCCVYPDSLPNFASNFRLPIFYCSVHHCGWWSILNS
jgi:hypothetical protein